jgi:hypothetical protein
MWLFFLSFLSFRFLFHLSFLPFLFMSFFLFYRWLLLFVYLIPWDVHIFYFKSFLLSLYSFLHSLWP